MDAHAVPSKADVLSSHSARRVETAGRVEDSVAHRESLDFPVRAAAKRVPGAPVPARHVVRYDAAHGVEIPTNEGHGATNHECADRAIGTRRSEARVPEVIARDLGRRGSLRAVVPDRQVQPGEATGDPRQDVAGAHVRR